MNENDETISTFMQGLHENIAYWDAQDITDKEKLEGFTHSILVMLDGMAAYWDGDISRLESVCHSLMLHENFYPKKNTDTT